MSERPDPLDRLSAFDHLEAPDQWDEIVRRAEDRDGVTELRPVVVAHRPRWLVAAAAATVLVAGAGILFAVNSGDEGEITTLTDPPTTVAVTTAPVPLTATTEPATSSTSPSTEPGPATAPESAPPTSGPSAEGAELAAWCTEAVAATVDPGPYADLLPVPFGPIEPDAGLVITLPNGPGNTDGSASTVLGVESADGAVIVLVQQASDAPAWQLVAIDTDGSIRWRRCGSEQSVELYAGATTALVQEQSAGWSAWRAFDVVTGEDAAVPSIEAERVAIDSTDRYLLVGNDASNGDFELVDLDTFEVVDLPDPGVAIEGEVAETQLVDREDGSVVVTLSEFGGPTLAVYVDGAWRTDRETLLAEVPLRVTETSDGDGRGLGNGVLATDPLGATVWFHDTVDGIRGEGWSTGVRGDVVLTNECRRDDPDASDGSYVCADPWHVALDLDTGDVLWEQPGFVAGGPSDRNIAMIADEAGWSLVDVRTREVLQADLPSFSTACCGEFAFVWSDRDGGVVWSVDYQTLRVYYPVGVAPPPAEVALTAD